MPILIKQLPQLSSNEASKLSIWRCISNDLIIKRHNYRSVDERFSVSDYKQSPAKRSQSGQAPRRLFVKITPWTAIDMSFHFIPEVSILRFVRDSII